MPRLLPPKPHKSYEELVNIIASRGMLIPDRERAERKLSQIGYYRLSGFWYPCRKIKTDQDGKYIKDPVTHKLIRDDSLQQNINFNDIVELYIFDKKLHQLMLDAIERIEIYVRSVIAHELGYHDPLAYTVPTYINPKFCSTWKNGNNRTRNQWDEWKQKHENQIERSQEECILWHKTSHREIPFWVAIEAWNFGIMSKYYEMLKGNFQNRICSRFNIPNAKIFKEWLRGINTLRNKCAHHARIWNQTFGNPIQIPNNPHFKGLDLDANARVRLYGMICVLWYLVRKIGPSSGWLQQVADIMDSKPSIDSCPYTAMGFPDNTGFPRDKFGL